MPGGFNLYSICIIFHSRVQLFIEPESFDTVWPFLESNRSAQCGAPTCRGREDAEAAMLHCLEMVGQQASHWTHIVLIGGFGVWWLLGQTKPRWDFKFSRFHICLKIAIIPIYIIKRGNTPFWRIGTTAHPFPQPVSLVLCWCVDMVMCHLVTDPVTCHLKVLVLPSPTQLTQLDDNIIQTETFVTDH